MATIDVMISEEEIAKKVEELAKQIEKDWLILLLFVLLDLVLFIFLGDRY